MSLEEWRTLFSAGTVITVIVATLNYWLARKKEKVESELNRDKELCAQAVLSLERSFNVLTSGNEKPVLPEASRLNWLTSARLIETYKKLKSELKTDLYKLVCSQHEEHWRHQFYLCLKDSVFQNQSYFQDKTNDTPKENIDPKSALIIFNFKQWEPGKLDPLKDVNKDNIINDGYTLNGEMGLEFYIDSLRSN